MQRRSSIEMDRLVVGSIEWVESQALLKESSRDLEKVVFKGLRSAGFQLLSFLQLLPESYYFTVVWVEL